jgi:hypothetical protein
MRLGCCSAKCGGNTECVCGSFLVDGMRLHFVGASKKAFYGLPSSMAALCTHNCTSRVWQDLKYIAEKNVTYGNRTYSKRFIADVPEKPGAKLWLGCVSNQGGTPVTWIRPIWGAINGLIQEDWNELEVYDKPERTFGRKSVYFLQNYADWWEPYFQIWTFEAFPGNGVELVHGETLDSSVVTELRNSQINLRHKHETDTICNLLNKWDLCGFVPVIRLSSGNEFIESYLAVIIANTLVFHYRQHDNVSGMLPGYRPFSFIPRTGDTPILVFPTFGAPWYQTGVGFRTEFRTEVRADTNGNQIISYTFRHNEFRRIFQQGFGEQWIRIVSAGGYQQWTVPVCSDRLEFNTPITVTKYYQGRPSVTTFNCKLHFSYATL